MSNEYDLALKNWENERNELAKQLALHEKNKPIDQSRITDLKIQAVNACIDFADHWGGGEPPTPRIKRFLSIGKELMSLGLVNQQSTE